MLINSYHQVKSLMEKFHIAPNKKFGQNFLLDENVLDKIAAYATDRVLEIGPGMGALTHFLCLYAQKVVAVEIDSGLVEVLHYSQGEHKNLTVIHGDFLEDQVQKQAEEALGGSYSVVANLPYYITTPILMELLSRRVPEMVLMMQKEVAQRICAKPGGKEYGTLSIAVQYAATVEPLFDVKPGSFYPKPAVDSSVIRIVRREHPAVEVCDEKLFFRVVKAGFAMRRKTLLNNLMQSFSISREQATQRLLAAGIDGRRRGETLTMEEYAKISDQISQITH